MSQSAPWTRATIAVLTAAAALAAAPAARAAGPLTLTSRVDSPQDTGYGEAADRIAVVDFNGDGIDDHALAAPNRVTVYLGARGNPTGGGTVTVNAAFGGSENRAVASAGDPDGDGYDDLLVTPQIGGARTYLVYGGATSPATIDLTAGPRITVITTGSWGPQYPHSVGIGDFDGDGKDDIAVPSVTGTGFSDGVSSVAIIAGGPRVATMRSQPAGGRVSLLTGFRSCSTRFIIYFPYFRTTCRAPDPDVVPIGDFNGDGKDDLYVNAKVDASSQTILLGRSGGGFSVPAGSPGEGSVNLTAVAGKANTQGFWSQVRAAGDVDGDRFEDFTMPSNVSLGVNGVGVVVRGRPNPPTSLPTDAVLRIDSPAGLVSGPIGSAGDQNGDGRTDLLVSRESPTSYAPAGLVVASLPAGASSFGAAAQSAVAGVPSTRFLMGAKTGDFDGDGATDVLVVDAAGAFRFTHAGGPVGTPTPTPTPTPVPTPFASPTPLPSPTPSPSPAPTPAPADFPTAGLAGWTASGSATPGGQLTMGPGQTGSLAWPKPINLNGKSITFSMTMGGGNGAAEGVALAFLDNVGGQPSGGFLGAGGGQLGFGGLGGHAVAFDVAKQAEDVQANTVSWVDGPQGTSLRKLYTRDAGIRLRGVTTQVRVTIKNGTVTVMINNKIVHTITATIPSSTFLAFTASTNASVWQWQQISAPSITDAP